MRGSIPPGANQAENASNNLGTGRHSRPSQNVRRFERGPTSPAGLFITFVQVVRAIERHLDGGLGVGVLSLQHFYCFPQLRQLGLLRRDNYRNGWWAHQRLCFFRVNVWNQHKSRVTGNKGLKSTRWQSFQWTRMRDKNQGRAFWRRQESPGGFAPKPSATCSE